MALYNEAGELLGALGFSGDTSCADHNIAWRTRNNLGLDYVPGGLSGDPERPDNIIYDIAPDGNGHPTSTGGFGHPHWVDSVGEGSVSANLPAIP